MPAIGYVHDRADELGVLGAVRFYAPQAMHIFYRALRRYDAKVALEVAAVASGLLQHGFDARAIVGMDPIHKRRIRRRRRVRIQSENAKKLRRPRGLPGRHVRGPASGSTY